MSFFFSAPALPNVPVSFVLSQVTVFPAASFRLAAPMLFDVNEAGNSPTVSFKNKIGGRADAIAVAIALKRSSPAGTGL